CPSSLMILNSFSAGIALAKQDNLRSRERIVVLCDRVRKALGKSMVTIIAEERRDNRLERFEQEKMRLLVNCGQKAKW
ncbi:MAG: hypothetical protein O7C56_05015, partial [Rickettsia endosymbiont of Ixodes persulcatus]|nr:hypothetical protein [Rickettsia endosymbiont of Ixodes persulcatus]